MTDTIQLARDFMKGHRAEDAADPAADISRSDQNRGVPPPPLFKEFDRRVATVIALPQGDSAILAEPNLVTLIRNRRSRREYLEQPLTLQELSYLLWATQGVLQVEQDHSGSLRTVPSSGACHPYETYLVVNRVEGLRPGIYRYLALTHELLQCDPPADPPAGSETCGRVTGSEACGRVRDSEAFGKVSVRDKLAAACFGESFAGDAPVCFIWSCIPYRGEWKYGSKSHKAMLVDAGHICQNLYLAAGSIGCGTCAIAGYDQDKIDALLGLDGHDEYVVYLAPVGKVEGTNPFS